MASSKAHTNVTTVNLASQTSKKAQSAQDILKQIESTLPGTSQQQGGLAQQQGGLSARLQGRINEHELAYGDKALPRQGLPKMNNVLLDRYQAARHNVLVLGAIQQAEGKSKSNTHRSHKSGSHTPARGPSRPGTGAGKAAASLAGDQAAADEAWGDGGSGALSAGPSGIGSDAFGSFKSRGSSKALGSIPEVDGLEAQPSAGVLQLEPEASTASAARSGRRYSRQGSNSSMVSRASASSTVASGLTGVSRASSAGRQLRQQHSHISSGDSSGHTLRSHRGGSVAGSNFGGHHKKGGKRKPPKPEPGRITRCFAEFGSKDDWVSKTVLKHTLASIIQAHWRGYWVRQRWKVNREQLVMDEQARLQAGALHEARLVELQHKLQQYEQKKLAQAAAEAAAAAAGQQEAGGEAAASSGVGVSAAPGPAAAAAAAGGGGGGMTSRGVSAAHRRGDGQLAAVASWQSMRSLGEPSYQAEGYAAYGGSDSDAGWSDVELDDVAAIKFRAVTPPWQRAPDRAHMSLALQQRTAAAAAAALGMPVEPADWGAGLAGMGSCWGDDGDDTTAKLQELRHRRICRKPEPVPLSAAAVAAAATAGLLAAGDTDGGTGAAATTDPDELPVGGDAAAAAAAALPQHVVEALLLERYSGKFARLGMPHKMPGRQRWRKMQAEAAAAAAAARDDGVLGPNEVPAVVAGVVGAEAPAVAGTDAAGADAAPTAAGAAV